MDIGFLIGMLGVWILIVWAMLSGGKITYFLDTPSIILVIGGSVAVMFYAFPVNYVAKMGSLLRRAIFSSTPDVSKLIEDMVSFAEIARRDGILSLENVTRDIKDPFVVRGIQMAVDGTDPELIEQILEAELDNTIDRHSVGKSIFDIMGKYSPALGMIGTLVGLVIMLQNMDDPSAIGPGMAVAILTTMYGAIIANAFALPISDRLARRSAEEVLYKTIIIKAVMAIQSGDNPRIVEQKLKTYLPASLRKDEDGDKEAA